MKNFSWTYVKKNPTIFIGIFLVFGLGLFLLLNRGGGASSGGTIVSGGPSEAFQIQAMGINAQAQSQMYAVQAERDQAAMALQAAGMQIEAQQNIAVLQSQLALAELQSTQTISSEQTAASLNALSMQLSNSFMMQESNNRAGVDMARMVQDTATQQLAIGAMMQQRMGDQQLEAFRIQSQAGLQQSLIAQVSSLKKKDRDTALAAIAASTAGQSFSGGKGDDYFRITSTVPLSISPSARPIA